MSESKRLLLIGAGGHCLSVLDSVLDKKDYAQIGIIDWKPMQQDNPITAMGISVVGTDLDLKRLHIEGYQYAFIAVGSVGDADVRKKLYKLVKEIGFTVPNIVDESSIISRHTSLGEGIYIGKNVIINAGSCIGNCAILNTGSIIEHGCRLSDFVHLATGAVTCGDVIIGSGSHIGAGSVIKQGITLGENVMIGMGSTVLKNFSSGVTAYGSPCKEV